MTNKSLIPTELNITSLGQIFSQSGYFSDAKDASKAIVKILAGQELGLPPIQSMTGINIIKGKVSLSAVAMATVLKRTDRYDYKVLENTEVACEIEFFQDGESIGKSRFTFDDAKRAGLEKKDNYKKYPRNMLFARTMSNGIRWYCPDVLGGPTYTPGELDEDIVEGSDDREIINGEIVDMAGQIDDFAEWMKTKMEVKNKALELSADIDLPPAMAIQQILPQLKEEYPDTTEADIIEMLK